MTKGETDPDSTDMNWSELGREWKTEEPGRLQSTRSQRAGHKLVTEQEDPTLSRSLDPTPTLNPGWPEGEPKATMPGKASGWRVSAQGSKGEGQGIGEHRQSQAIHRHISIFIY